MEKLIHLFIPRHSNNHKAKILHPSSLTIIAVLLILFQGVINLIPKINPDILGYASNISIQDVVSLTNQKRAQAGLSALTFNQTLSNAAYTKGKDMLAKDYWAHVAPDGTQPWKFFSDFGYKYRYAGENLARDFSNASSAVEAWMNSPTHRENILNPKYKEIGIGVVEGDLAGVDTTIIVQFFGTTYADRVPQPLAQGAKVEQKSELASPVPVATIKPVVTSVPTIFPTPQPVKVLVSPFTTTRTISLVSVLLLAIVFIVDAFLVTRRKITRIAGRSFAHVAFLGMIIVIIMLLRAGEII